MCNKTKQKFKFCLSLTEVRREEFWIKSIISKKSSVEFEECLTVRKRRVEFCLSVSLVRKRRVEFCLSLTLVRKGSVEFEESLTEVRKEVSNFV